MKDYRIIVAGGRGFKDYSLVETELDGYLKECGIEDGDTVTIASGCCEGADALGEKYAKEHGYEIAYFPADWFHYGASAVPIQNVLMAEYAVNGIGALFAFWNGMSRGTKNMIEIAQKMSLDVHVVRY